MIYRPKAAELEGAEFELAGGRYVAVALEGAVHTVPAEVFGLLFEQAATRQNFPVSFEETCKQYAESELRVAGRALAEFEKQADPPPTHPDVKQPDPAVAPAPPRPKRNQNTDRWNGASSKAQRDPETVPHCDQATVPRANPTAPAKQSPAREKVLRIVQENGPITTKEIGLIAYPDHGTQEAAINTYPITQALEAAGQIKRVEFVENNEFGTPRKVNKWVAA